MTRPSPKPLGLALAATLVLAGCLQPQQSMRVIGAPAAAPAAAAPAAAPAALPAPPPTAVATASRAEAACIDQGRAQGLSVERVAGTRAITGADGQSTGRDVMLRVSRDGQVYEVRCSYQSATDQARIMSL